MIDAPSDQRAPGFYRCRLVRAGPWVAFRIMCEEGWWLLIQNGKPTSEVAMADYNAVPGMAKMIYAKEISADAYAALLAASAAAPEGSPLANPDRPVDLRAAPSLY